MLMHSNASAAINDELSKMLYDIPAAPGMVMERKKESIEGMVGRDIKTHVALFAFRNQKGINIPPSKIIEFYDNHFESKGFNKSGDSEELSSRYNAPSLVTKGKAYVWSQGHISYHVPEKGDFIAFWVEQRRSTDMRDSEDTIAKINNLFSNVSNKLGYKYSVPQNIWVGDIGKYIANECFVDRVISLIQHQKSEEGFMGDDGTYMFYFVVFPDHKYALQWRDKTIEDVKKRRPHPNYHEDGGLGLSPVVIDNIVVEYIGDVHDISNSALKEELTHALELLSLQY